MYDHVDQIMINFMDNETKRRAQIAQANGGMIVDGDRIVLALDIEHEHEWDDTINKLEVHLIKQAFSDPTKIKEAFAFINALRVHINKARLQLHEQQDHRSGSLRSA